MTELLSRRNFILSGAAALAFPAEAVAQTPRDRLRTYNFNPDGVYAAVNSFHDGAPIEMDIGLLHPQTGAPSIGFYAALDPAHGEPFSLGWNNFYNRYFGDRSVHDPDRGLLIQIVNHIRAHGIPVEAFTESYNRAKTEWDQRPDLRFAELPQPKEFDIA